MLTCSESWSASFLRSMPSTCSPNQPYTGGLCRRASRRSDGDARRIAYRLVRPARCFKGTPKGRGSAVYSNHAGLCHYPALLHARHPFCGPSPGSPTGHSRGGRWHARRDFAVGQDRRRQIPLFRPVDAVDRGLDLDPLNRDRHRSAAGAPDKILLVKSRLKICGNFLAHTQRHVLVAIDSLKRDEMARELEMLIV